MRLEYNFGSLTNTAYSDGTPSIAFTYNALGQMKTVTDASGTRTLDYAADGQLLAETLTFNTSLFTLHEKFDILGRNAGYALSNEVALITGTMQSFDLYGRLNQVAVDGIDNAFTYGYLEGSHLQKTLSMPDGVTRTFGYEDNRDLLTSIIHSNATDRLVQRDFTFDGHALLENRSLFRANEAPVVPDAFGYNIRSELTNAVIGANAFAYNFDPIGNRLEAKEFGTNTAYTANALNQYTQLSLLPPNSSFLPQHDADGNQLVLRTTTGIWHVWYNGENRPVLFSNDTTKVEMSYDYMGRRFEYKETVNNTLTRHERYLYRGYLQLAALDILNNANVKHTIAWDPSEPTATRPLALQVGANAYFYSFDQVKNVTELFDSAGALAATYDYSPFGQVTSFQITQSGNNAITQFANPLTFSSEIYDSTLGLQYYNFRHLNVMDGRWVNRDPIGEDGGVNLYRFVDNSAVISIDLIGFDTVTIKRENKEKRWTQYNNTQMDLSVEMQPVKKKDDEYCIRHTKIGALIIVTSSAKWMPHEEEHVNDMTKGVQAFHDRVVSYERCYCSNAKGTALARANAAIRAINEFLLFAEYFKISADTVERVDLGKLKWVDWAPSRKGQYTKQAKLYRNQQKDFEERFALDYTSAGDPDDYH